MMIEVFPHTLKVSILTDSTVYILYQDIQNMHSSSSVSYPELLNDFFQVIAVQFEPSDLFYLNGKPYLRNGYHLSVSKTPERVFIGVSRDHIGIDVECIEDLNINDSHYNFLHRNEALFSSNKRNFATVWTRKESLFKIIGTQYLNSSALFDCSKDYIDFGSRYTFKNVNLTSNLILTVCSSNPKIKIKVFDQIELKC